LAQQRQTIEGELDAAVARAGDNAYRPAEEAYAAEVRALSWSDPAIASALQAATTAMLEAAPAPPFCADASAWAQSGYRALPAPTREFEASRVARKSSDQQERLAGLLKPYQNDTSDRALIRKTNAVEGELFAKSLAIVQTVFSVARIVGFPRTRTEEHKRIALGHGRTAAGTRFEVSSESGPLGLFGSCHSSATVAYSRPGAPELLIVGVPNNPICLFPPQYRHPALFCEAGIETIQAARRLSRCAQGRGERLLRASMRLQGAIDQVGVNREWLPSHRSWRRVWLAVITAEGRAASRWRWHRRARPRLRSDPRYVSKLRNELNKLRAEP
jgi:hypothetical protein